MVLANSDRNRGRAQRNPTAAGVGAVGLGPRGQGRRSARRRAPLAASAKLSPLAPPAARGPVDPMPGLRRDFEVAPAAYIAQHPIPGEPLGFSQTKFDPTSGPIVDPSTSGEMTYGPYEEEFFDSDDPEGPAPAVSSGEWIRNGFWYADVAATYFDRSAAVKNDVPLSFDFITADKPQPQYPSLRKRPGLPAWRELHAGALYQDATFAIAIIRSSSRFWA